MNPGPYGAHRIEIHTTTRMSSSVPPVALTLKLNMPHTFLYIKRSRNKKWRDKNKTMKFKAY